MHMYMYKETMATNKFGRNTIQCQVRQVSVYLKLPKESIAIDKVILKQERENACKTSHCIQYAHIKFNRKREGERQRERQRDRNRD